MITNFIMGFYCSKTKSRKLFLDLIVSGNVIHILSCHRRNGNPYA